MCCDIIFEMKSYQEIRRESLIKYKSYTAIISPALNIEVVFNAKGFNHLLYESGSVARTRENQIQRFNLLDLAYELVSYANTYQEYEYDEEKKVYYWGIIAIYKNNKVKVILKRNAENGKVYFWSVIPQYVTNPKRDSKLMKGEPEID